MATIAIIACCDTKYHEIKFVQEQILASGHQPLVMDISTGPDIPMKADISREEILAAGGYTWDQIHAFDKSGAISAMTESISKLLLRLVQEKKIDGVMGMGGLQNTVVCSAAMRLLPMGFPKIICSTIASGFRYFDTVVGEKDIVVVPSIVDFAGVNPITETVLGNTISALIGMVTYGGKPIDTKGEPYIGTTLMGITNDTVMRASDMLTASGRKLISFHSTGMGGRVMETLIREGVISAVMDLSLHEMTAEYFGGYGYSRGADNRLCAAAEKGIPALICPGGIDFACLNREDMFDDEEERGYVWHNKDLTHTRLYEREILDITRTIVERLNRSKGRTEVLLPMGGLRTLSYPGEFFHKPETIRKMKTIFEEGLKPEIIFKAVDLNFCDPEFADLCANEMEALLAGDPVWEKRQIPRKEENA
ncbi:MAG: Tm-1-like ATP-binding domain-containing protein [Clostridiales bacterium]|nr:Tm-1-like ATP-binding domain-containing protein [Clostridiales bacterium]